MNPEEAAALKKRHAEQGGDRAKKMSPEEAEALKKRHSEQKSERVKKTSPEEAAALKRCYAEQKSERLKKASPEEAACNARHENLSSPRHTADGCGSSPPSGLVLSRGKCAHHSLPMLATTNEESQVSVLSA